MGEPRKEVWARQDRPWGSGNAGPAAAQGTHRVRSRRRAALEAPASGLVSQKRVLPAFMRSLGGEKCLPDAPGP